MAKILIAGGGTGGHLYSGIAVAREWVLRGGEVLFVGTSRGLEKTLIPKAGFKINYLPTSGMKGLGVVKKIFGMLVLCVATLRACHILLREKPAVVLGIGGYASAPCLLAALLFPGKMRAVIDQNALPGMTNRMLGRFVHRVFLHFEEARAYFKPEKIRMTGNPLARDLTRTPKQAGPLQTGPLTLLVCGGSQGALRLNELMRNIFPKLKETLPELKLIHQTGARAEVLDYGALAGATWVEPFFDPIEEVYAQADLVLSRAGAGTLTELAAFGLPAVLIPYPYAADNHQRINALAFVKKNAAVMLEQKDLTEEKLTETLLDLLQDGKKRLAMGEAAKKLARPKATQEIVDELEKLRNSNLHI